MKFFIKYFLSNVTKSAGALVTFTEEILNGKLHFLAVLSFDYFKIKN